MTLPAIRPGVKRGLWSSHTPVRWRTRCGGRRRASNGSWSLQPCMADEVTATGNSPNQGSAAYDPAVHDEWVSRWPRYDRVLPQRRRNRQTNDASVRRIARPSQPVLSQSGEPPAQPPQSGVATDSGGRGQVPAIQADHTKNQAVRTCPARPPSSSRRWSGQRVRPPSPLPPWHRCPSSVAPRQKHRIGFRAHRREGQPYVPEWPTAGLPHSRALQFPAAIRVPPPMTWRRTWQKNHPAIGFPGWRARRANRQDCGLGSGCVTFRQSDCSFRQNRGQTSAPACFCAKKPIKDNMQFSGGRHERMVARVGDLSGLSPVVSG